jgi:hypothetical protein
MASAKKHYIFSTLSNDQRYQDYSIAGHGVLTPTRSVSIKGGAGVANNRLMTPLGVVTEVSDEDLSFLESHECFKIHKSNGFITVRPKNADAEVVAADMARGDGCAPMNPETVLAKANKETKIYVPV